MMLGTPPYIRKLLPCGSRQARPISQSFSDIRTPSSGGRQSIGTVGFNGPPDGSPRVGKTPMRGIASPYISPSSGEMPTSVPVTVRGPAKLRGAVSGKESDTAKRLPGAGAALTPVPLTACSMQVTSSRSQTVSEGPMPLQRLVPIPSKGAVPPRPVVSVSLQQPGKKAIVNRGQASIVERSQVASVTPEPPRCPAPVPSKGAVPHRPAVSTTVRSPERKTMVSKGQTSLKLGSPLRSTTLCPPARPKAAPSKHAIPFCFPKDKSITLVGHEAAGKVKQLGRAVYDDRLSCERPEHRLEHSSERSNTEQGLAVERAQTPFPDEEGEE